MSSDTPQKRPGFCSRFWSACCCCSCSSSASSKLTAAKNPMRNGDQFVELTDEYINQFDEVIVVGDIHGCYDEFNELLQLVHKETPSKQAQKCLKILVGDLVNKGPDSKRVIELCLDKYPGSIIAVRGNHDSIIMTMHQRYKSEKDFKLEEKYKWISKLPDRYIEYLRMLPLSISVPSLNSIIVHAGIDPSRENPAKDTPASTLTSIRNIKVLKDARTQEIKYECTNKIDEGAPWATFWPGPQHVYFGHDARRRLQADHEFATGLDTGCVYGDRLTYVYIKGARKGTINSVKARKVYETPKGSE